MKYLQPFRNGIQAHQVSRYSIGYVVRGHKHIYYGDSRREFSAGDLFFLGIGTHYMEDLPDGERAFEQISFFYSPEELATVLTTLNLTYDYPIGGEKRSAERSDEQNFAVWPAWPIVKAFFTTMNHYLRDELFLSDRTLHRLKFVELIFLLLENQESPLRRRVLGSTDSLSESFEQIIQRHIFDNLSIEELSSMCHRSLTSFKKEFRRHFDSPPHRWLTRQRLLQARLLLISTGKSVSEIGNDCNIPNTSHFIKLFKKEYGTTPSQYRQIHCGTENNSDPTQHPSKTLNKSAQH